MVEHDLAKVGVASSSLVCRSNAGPVSCICFLDKHSKPAQMAELVDALVSGASVVRRAGSSPVLGTLYELRLSGFDVLKLCAGGEIGIHATLRG